MDCSYCKKDMADSDICPSCGMGKRVDFELFKTDKAEIQKNFEEYERNYLNKLNGTEETPEKVKEELSISKTTRHIQNNDGLPSISSGLGFLGKMAIFIVLGLITGAILALTK